MHLGGKKWRLFLIYYMISFIYFYISDLIFISVSPPPFPFSLNLTVRWKPSSFPCLKTYVLQGCLLKTVSPSGTICHAPGVLGAGDRYFPRGAAPFHFLRAPSRRNLLPLPPIYLYFTVFKKKEARVSPGPLLKNRLRIGAPGPLGHVSWPREHRFLFSLGCWWFRRIGC